MVEKSNALDVQDPPKDRNNEKKAKVRNLLGGVDNALSHYRL